jgi:hypothetical protein
MGVRGDAAFNHMLACATACISTHPLCGRNGATNADISCCEPPQALACDGVAEEERNHMTMLSIMIRPQGPDW